MDCCINHKKILQLRREKDISQQELAWSVNTNQSFVSLLESGKVNDVGVKLLCRMAEYLNVDISELLV